MANLVGEGNLCFNSHCFAPLAFTWLAAEQRKKLEKAKRLNERLQQVDKLKDQFLANTSHELCTPLQGIIGLSESLIDNVRTDPPEIYKTSMAKPFGKCIIDFLRQKSTQKHILLLEERYAAEPDRQVLRILKRGESELQGT